ncbi:tannase/feruloyl esterase family alpha/beta hydrolase [Rhodobacteraceae bacterium]|nr:tannase/feruloyl esterase family alpha/beta hydrolase [Paracoccaceae bacterium]
MRDNFRGVVGAASLLALAAGTAHAQNRASFSEVPQGAWFSFAPVSPAMDCASIERLALDEVTFLKATAVDTGDAPAFCRVEGIIRPEIKFEIALPNTWNRRLYMFGNGGYAGRDLSSPQRVANRDAAVKNGFMSVQQNTGHDERTDPLGTFADGNLEKLVDYSHRAVHVTVNTAKALAEVYYSDRPSYSYWDGCSTGGRQGLMSAQRYPTDFDGIVAGAPVLEFNNTQLWNVYNAQQLLKGPLSYDQLPVLAKAVMGKCDAADGLEDGLITDPRQCNFDPATDLPRCEGAAGETCFTDDQIAAVQGLHDGVIVDGEQVYPGVQWGVEGIDTNGNSGWKAWMVTEEGQSRQLAYGETYVQNIALLPKRGTDIDWRSFDIPANFGDVQMARDLLDANQPHLSEFERQGGRMISYFGWSDPALNPMMGVNYYEDVRETMGAERTSAFYRLFMAPGMFHCRAGYGPDSFDAMVPLIKWVETGEAPEQIVARQIKDGETLRSRPLCPYPQVARYSGEGDETDASSFKCALPE